MYIYDPIKQRKEEKDKNFWFRNLSGNVINNPKHTLLDKTQLIYIIHHIVALTIAYYIYNDYIKYDIIKYFILYESS